MIYFRINKFKYRQKLIPRSFILENIHRVIGKKIKEIRKNSGITQEQLSEYAGITPNYISLLENGRKRASIETLDKISKALKVPISKLFDFSYNAKKTKSSYEKKLKILIENLSEKDKLFVMDMISKMKKYKKK